MQLMPATARDLGLADPFDPAANVEAGVAYLRRLADEFGTVLALAAYNAGPGTVRRHEGVPPFAETRAYVRSVVLGLIRLRAGLPAR
jgi:soluble lytic murein transglycosylase-like protein